MHVIASAHVSTYATSLIHVANSTPPSAYDTYCLGHCNEKNEKKIKNIKLNSDHFPLTFVNLLSA